MGWASVCGQTWAALYVTVANFVPFAVNRLSSFLILIARFVTIVLWLSTGHTPMHHAMTMVSSADCGLRGLGG